MTDFGDVTHPKAAKEHRCIWCGETILKGEVCGRGDEDSGKMT